MRVGLVFVTVFENRWSLQTYVSYIALESKLWIAEVPTIRFNLNVNVL